MNNQTFKRIEYNCWKITMRGNGFMPIFDPNYFVASFEVIRPTDNLIAIFAFGVSVYEMFSEGKYDTPKLEMAIQEIKRRIDNDSIKHLEEYVYECYAQNVLEFENRHYWNKTLKNYARFFQQK